jgi:hypothetical protein
MRFAVPSSLATGLTKISDTPIFIAAYTSVPRSSNGLFIAIVALKSLVDFDILKLAWLLND